jgi:hypothetical protein
MIVEKQTEVLVLNDGEESQASIGMSLDLDSAQMLMQMLSKNLYADGIGSTIRETASNALDSHRRAGVTDVPIIVSLGINTEDNYEFCVEDFGAGLDDRDVENVISKYGKSTKRGSANELGMFGLGFKSPLAYSSTFFFICRKNGVERKYMMYEGDDVNTIDLLHEAPTTERNGVKIIVPINYRDRYEFANKIREQLAYFESVYFKIDMPGHSIDNNFSITRSTLFQFSELAANKFMHLCLDNVYYPLDFDKLGIRSIEIPIGLRFNLSDGLYPTPNRESLRYTTEAKATILARIAEVANHFTTKYNETITDSDKIAAVFNYYTTVRRHVDLGIDNRSIEITDLLPHATVPIATPQFKSAPHLDMKALAHKQADICAEYINKYNLSYGRYSENKSTWNTKTGLSDFEPVNYLLTDRFCGVKKAYYREMSASSGTVKFIKKTDPFVLKSRTGNSYYNTLNLRKVPKNLWRTHIKEFQYIQSLFVSNLKSVDEFVIPQEWLDDRKAKGLTVIGATVKREPKLQGEVIGKICSPLLRTVIGKNSKLEPITIKLADIPVDDSIYVYSNIGDIDLLDRLYHICMESQKVKILVFSEREIKVLSTLNLPNLMTLSVFMEGNNDLFKRLVTASLINEMITNNQNTFRNIGILNSVSTTMVSELEALLQYKSVNHVYADTTIQDAMKAVAATFNLYDETMQPAYIYMQALLDKLKFLEPVMRTMSPYVRASAAGGSEMIDIIRDLCTYYEYPIDPIVEEVVEETLTINN